ncbi:hypothetical protein [uncultured Clostridium sp.]|uniref:hypothetical protein n=1 Tax=uncultured Clostridium sp. TaxID=59620 RepID=UPI0028E26522|nr:hypothetical protein [uncultured Clostridium sp.]
MNGILILRPNERLVISYNRLVNTLEINVIRQGNNGRWTGIQHINCDKISKMKGDEFNTALGKKIGFLLYHGRRLEKKSQVNSRIR